MITKEFARGIMNRQTARILECLGVFPCTLERFSTIKFEDALPEINMYRNHIDVITAHGARKFSIPENRWVGFGRDTDNIDHLYSYSNLDWKLETSYATVAGRVDDLGRDVVLQSDYVTELFYTDSLAYPYREVSLCNGQVFHVIVNGLPMTSTYMDNDNEVCDMVSHTYRYNSDGKVIEYYLNDILIFTLTDFWGEK